MSTASPMTAEQLTRLANGQRCELLRGELKMMSPAGGEHGRIAMKIGRLLGNHVAARQLGEVFAAETGFLLSQDPDTVRAPDVAFVNARAFSDLQDTSGFIPLAPDLVVEVVSPNDSSSYVEEKAHSWIEFGVRQVLVVDPINRSVRSYSEYGAIQAYFSGETVDANEVVSGWTFDLSEIF